MHALGAGRIINIKPGRVGGFAPSIAIHDFCEQHGIPVWCGGMLESGVGRAYNVALASLPNFTKPGDVSPSARYWERDIVTPEWTMDAGHGQGAARQPGIGVDRRHRSRRQPDGAQQRSLARGVTCRCCSLPLRSLFTRCRRRGARRAAARPAPASRSCRGRSSAPAARLAEAVAALGAGTSRASRARASSRDSPAATAPRRSSRFAATSTRCRSRRRRDSRSRPSSPGVMHACGHDIHSTWAAEGQVAGDATCRR